MISRLRGVVVSRETDRVEVGTEGGVVYEVEVPLTVFNKVPSPGSPVELRTVHVVTDSSASLYGFFEAHERTLFRRLLSASGVGAKLALAMMSTFTAVRLARALVERDIAALCQVPGIGKKKAEKLAVELSDKVDDLAVGDGAGAAASTAQAAVQALIALGFTFSEADRAVRDALEDGDPGDTERLIRKALAG